MVSDQTATVIVERLEEAEKLKLMGKHDDAITILEQLIVDDPENVSAFEELADNELSLERYDRAENAALQAVTIDHDSYTAQYIMGYLECKKTNWEQAAEYFATANKLRPNNSEILRCLGWTLFNSGQYAQGIVTLERSLNLENDNPLTLCDLGIAYLQTKNFPKASKLFERTLEVDPGNQRAQECLQALAHLEKLLKSS